jgi:hypothetical protein
MRTVNDQNRQIFQKLASFVRGLGWTPLVRSVVLVKSHDGVCSIARWYESGDETQCQIYINEQPCICAAVYAHRFGLCSGWYPLSIAEDGSITSTVTSIEDRLSRDSFESAKNRRLFRNRFPECGGYTARYLRRVGEPYDFYGRSRTSRLAERKKND